MHVRREWEFAEDGAVLDLARFAATPLADLADAASLHQRLAVAFHVDMRRTAWRISPAPGTRLEVALDAGFVESRGRREALCEVEIEVLEGDADEAFRLASLLLEEVALRPGTVTKAQRGQRLMAGTREVPRKARSASLDPGWSHARAAREVVRAGLEQLQANEQGLLDSDDPEFVHQARIALRRIRSALRIFRDAIGRERACAWREALRETARALGGARDWDVLAGESLPSAGRDFAAAGLPAELVERAALRCARERQAARAAIRSAGYARTVLEIARWLAAPADHDAADGRSLATFAARVLRKRHRRLVRDGARVARMTAQERHRLRKDAKRLRYGSDALASLFPPGRVGPLLEALSALQDALGEANDAVNALRLLPELEPAEPFASFAREWFAARDRPPAQPLAALVAAVSAPAPFRPHGG